MFRWLFSKGASQREVAQMGKAIEPALWQHQLESLPFLAGLDESELQRLHASSAWILASKTFDGVQGLTVSDGMALCIAMQAALPIMNIGTSWYEGWSGIIVYPDNFVARHPYLDANGVVHPQSEELLGESWQHGPVVLSWQAARPHRQRRAANVVIHEFAHKLDMVHSQANGMPLLAGTGLTEREWKQTLESSWRRFCRSVEIVEAAIPPDTDPDSARGEHYYHGLPMDAYAATDTAEFFAVSSEAFFTNPAELRQWQPLWYDMLSRFYHQDPAERLARAQPARESGVPGTARAHPGV